MHGLPCPRLRPPAALHAAALLLLAACVGPPEPQGRGWAPPVLPAQASLVAAGEGSGGAVALLIETQRGVLLRVAGTRLAQGRHELVLVPDEERGWPLERLGFVPVGRDGQGTLELELAGHTLTADSRLLGRHLALIGPAQEVLRGEIEKGLEVEQDRTPPAAPARPPTEPAGMPPPDAGRSP